VVERIKLEGRIKSDAPLNFLAVEVPIETDRYIPFASVLYAINGEAQTTRLRLDLDKRTFADHFTNPAWERTLHLAGEQIADIVAKELRRTTYERLRKEFA